MKRQAAPIFVPEADGPSSALQRCDFHDNGHYDEAWLQALIHEHPTVLPIWEIEPALRDAVPVCRELPLPSGSLDNLLVTQQGDLVLVECKLWRNPQARREVVAQIIDYAKDLKGLDYTALEAAIRKARQENDAVLYNLVEPEVEEANFVDAVSRNLWRGRALLVVAGDGITESVEYIADYLQQHAGIHFTLALVQLAIYELPGGGKLVVPSVPLRTSNVVRGIVTIEDGKVEVAAPLDTSRSRQAVTLSEEEFFAKLNNLRPDTSERLLALVERGRDIGFYYDVKKSLMIRLPVGDDYANVLVIYANGDADVSYVWWLKDRVSAKVIGQYLEDVARTIEGTKVQGTPKMPYVRFPDRYLTVWDVLDHGDEWLDAVRRFRDAVIKAVER